MPKVGFELGTSQILDATVIWGSIPDSNPGEGNSIFFHVRKIANFPYCGATRWQIFFPKLNSGAKDFLMSYLLLQFRGKRSLVIGAKNLSSRAF